MRIHAFALVTLLVFSIGCQSGTPVNPIATDVARAQAVAATLTAAAPTSIPYSSPAPPPSPTHPRLEPVKAWVCVDLAYGYVEPNEYSRRLFQMSQRDGWIVYVYGMTNGWYAVGNGDSFAYMSPDTLCGEDPKAGIAKRDQELRESFTNYMKEWIKKIDSAK